MGSSSSHYSQTGQKYHGTINPASNFNAEQDSTALRNAIRGVDTDKEAIIEVVGRRSNAQRQEIKKQFKAMWGKDLIEELKGELISDFRDLVIGLFEEPARYDAVCLRDAMEGAGTKEDVLTEILITRTSSEVNKIKAVYKELFCLCSDFKRDLEEDVVSDTSGDYRRILLSCLRDSRNELSSDQLNKLENHGVSAVVDKDLARKEAEELFNAGEKRFGTDESVFIRVICTRNVYQLRCTFDEYQKISGHDIYTAIKNETSGDLKEALTAIALSLLDRPHYFANKLFDVMNGAGTNDSALIRIIITRSEIDLDDIKKAFHKPHLSDMVKDDTSGDYCKLLLLIVGQ